MVEPQISYTGVKVTEEIRLIMNFDCMVQYLSSGFDVIQINIDWLRYIHCVPNIVVEIALCV